MNKLLKEHMSSAGIECKFAKINSGGNGGALYQTAEDAAVAIASLNGSVFEGVRIQLDVWEKPATE